MITEEHFKVLDQLRDESQKLRLLCIEKADGAALIHVGFGAGADINIPEDQMRPLRKLWAVK